MEKKLNNASLVILFSIVWVIINYVIFVGFDGEFEFVTVLLFLLYSYASIMLWNTALSKNNAPLLMIFWLFHTNFLLLPALSQSFHKTFYWSSYYSYSHEILLYVCFIIFLGLIAFRFGGRVAKRKIKFGIKANHFLNNALVPSSRIQIFLILVLLFLMLILAKFGTSFFMSDRMGSLSRVNSKSELGLFMTLPRSIAYGVLLFSVVLLLQSWRGGRNISFVSFSIVIIAFLLNMVINYPLSISRFWFFGFLISLIWIFGLLDNSKLRSIFIVSFSFLQLTIFPWFSQITRGKGEVDFNIESIRQYMHHGDFDGFQSMANIVLYAQGNGFEFGRNLISVILFFIPRTIWDKAQPLGEAASNFMGYVYTNLSAPIYGELYIDFGLFSLIVGMVVIGFGVTLFDDYYLLLRKRNSLGVGILLTSVLAGFTIIILRGSLLAIMPSFATLFMFLVIASWLSNVKSNNILKR